MQELNKWQQELKQLSDYAENATSKKLFKYYRQALIDIKKEMKAFIEKYEDLSFSKKLEAERLLLNGKQIDSILRETYRLANGAVETYASDEATRGYYGTWYALEGAHNIQLDMNMLPERYIKQLVHHPVKGRVFSKRLYKHRDRLAKETTNALLDAARKGKSYAVAAKQIEGLTEASYKRAFRIARTEGGRVQSTAKQRSYVEAKKKGIDLKKKWLATLDNDTRDSHQSLDGQTVEVEDQFETEDGHKGDGPRLFGVASEDIHCRCTTTTEVEGFSPELRVDNEGNTFPYKNYKEWFDYKKKRLESGIIGLSTKDNVKIQDIAEHLFHRKGERDVDFKAITQALANPLHIYPDKIDSNGVSRKYLGASATVAVNPVTGKVITTYKTSEKRRKKYET